LDKFGIDPALATGPFITTSNDICGILIYFSIARIILGFLQTSDFVQYTVLLMDKLLTKTKKLKPKIENRDESTYNGRKPWNFNRDRNI
jgi:hypothetical protein